MENASKALIMAGGVLLAVMILSLVLYVASAMGDMAESQDTRIAAQQLKEFNESYLAYNKTRMYGTDVITVVNKAIDHNKTITANTTDPYYINIKIMPNQTFKTSVVKIDNTKENPKQEPVDRITNDIKNILGNPSNSYEAYLSAGITYELGTWQNSGENFIMNNNFLQFFEGDTIDKTETTSDKKTTYIMYSALTNFKTAIFTCEDVNGDGKAIEYNQDGRIKSMEFKQR